MKKETKTLAPTSLGAARKAKEALRGKSQELVDEFRLMIKQAVGAGKFEEALKAQQWLIEHAPADEDGSRIVEVSIDKAGPVESGQKGPLVQIANFQLGGLAKPKQVIEVIEAEKITDGR